MTFARMIDKLLLFGGIAVSATAGKVVSDATTVPIGFAIAAIGVVGSGALWAGKWFQKIEDRFDTQQQSMSDGFRGVNARLDSLPCELRKCPGSDKKGTKH